jgi:ParB family transcriptional regulator, chromosome partitioning protein
MERKPEKRVLGRGLSQLMSETNLASSTNTAQQPDQNLPIERVYPNPLQPRKDFEPEALQELASSIRSKGILQPLIVRPSADPDRYEIVAGERRWRAAQLAQLHQVPVLIRTLSDQEVLEIAIIENIQRANLNPLEEAMGYKQLMETYGHTQDMVAEALSKSRSHIANLLRLLSLPQKVLDMVRAGTLSAGHARALITSNDPTALAERVLAKGLSVRETERMVREARSPDTKTTGRHPRGAEKDADTRALEADLSAGLGMPVNIMHEPGGEMGVISVRYRTLEELDALCQALSAVRRDILAS